MHTLQKAQPCEVLRRYVRAYAQRQTGAINLVVVEACPAQLQTSQESVKPMARKRALRSRQAEGVDLVLGLDVNCAVQDCRLSSEERIKAMAVRIDDRSEKRSRRGIKHHQFAGVGDIVNHAVGHCHSGPAFFRRLTSPQESTSDGVEGPQTKSRILRVNEHFAVSDCRRGDVYAHGVLHPTEASSAGI